MKISIALCLVIIISLIASISAQSIATELAQIDFSNIIGGPLVAAVNAQVQASNAALQFISAVGFDSTDVNSTTTNPNFGAVKSALFQNSYVSFNLK